MGDPCYYAGVLYVPGDPATIHQAGQVIVRSSDNTRWIFKDLLPNRLDGDTDVSISSPADHQVLAYEAASSLWKNQSLPSPALSLDTDVRVVSPADGDVLTFDGTSGLWTNKVSGGGGGGGGSILAGVGGFGSDSQGSQVIAYSQNTTIAWGPFSPLDTDSAHTASITAGHLYRSVFFFRGSPSGANLALMAAGLSGSSSKGYFIGDAGIYAVNGTGYSNIQGNGFGQNVLDDSDTPAHDQIVEVYLWVKAAGKNRLWAKGLGARWEAVNDTSCDFVANGLQIGYNGGTLNNIYVYELGAVPTS